jgi:hypothetical protein
MTAPTEAEIRETITAAMPAAAGTIGDRAYELTFSIRYLWGDLPPSQGARIEALIEEAQAAIEALEPEVLGRVREAVAAAAMTFAAEYPDAPRARAAVPA